MIAGILHWLGIDDVSGPAYAFWSGFGSILVPPLLTAVPIVWVMLRRNNCEVHGCWRLGRHQTEAGHHVCRRHHPSDHLTSADVRQAHHEAIGSRKGR